MLAARLRMFLEASLDTFDVDDVTELLAIVDVLADLGEAELPTVACLALLVVAVKEILDAADRFVDRWSVLVGITALVHLLLHAFLGGGLRRGVIGLAGSGRDGSRQQFASHFRALTLGCSRGHQEAFGRLSSVHLRQLLRGERLLRLV